MNSLSTNCVIRKLHPNDLDQVRQMCSTLNYRHYKHDEMLARKIDPDGLLVAEDLDQGEIVGLCYAVNHSIDLAFIGLFVVRSDATGQGVGSELWTQAMKHIGRDRNIGLYASLSMTDHYINNGFTAVADRKLSYFCGRAHWQTLAGDVCGVSIVPIDQNNLDALVKYDRLVCDGIDRKALIEQLPTAPDLTSAVAVTDSNTVVGYGVLCITNYDRALVLGLYADNEIVAEVLVTQLCRRLPIGEHQEMEYYCWDSNHKSVAIADKLGLKLFRSQKLLFTEEVVDCQLEKIFCVSSRNLYPF